MRICHECGAKNSDGARFCQHCGRELIQMVTGCRLNRLHRAENQTPQGIGRLSLLQMIAFGEAVCLAVVIACIFCDRLYKIQSTYSCRKVFLGICVQRLVCHV